MKSAIIPRHLGQRFLFGSMCLAMLSLCSCGGKDTATVRGTVSYKGQKVTSGAVMFYPIDKDSTSPGKPGTAVIQADGTYLIDATKKGEGAIVGPNKLTYVPDSNLPKGVTLKEGQSYRSPFDGLGIRNNQQEITIAAGANEINIELVTK